MLNTSRLLPYAEWCNMMYDEGHANPYYRWKDAVHIKRFYETIKANEYLCDGIITHIAYGRLNNIKHLMYSEGTPVFHFFKLVPDYYFIYNYDPDDLWRAYPIDDGIIDLYKSNGVNKYVTNESSIHLDHEYILVPLQRDDEQHDLIKAICEWSLTNKKHVVFKAHPYSKTSHNMTSWFPSNDYVKLVFDGYIDSLVNGAKMIWTDDSGVGLNALIAKKPVSYFKKTYDFTYGPIAKYCKTLDDAYDNQGTPDEYLYRYLSWYYHRFVIDMKSSAAEDKIIERLDLYFNKNYDVRKLFG